MDDEDINRGGLFVRFLQWINLKGKGCIKKSKDSNELQEHWKDGEESYR